MTGDDWRPVPRHGYPQRDVPDASPRIPETPNYVIHPPRPQGLGSKGVGHRRHLLIGGGVLAITTIVAVVLAAPGPRASPPSPPFSPSPVAPAPTLPEAPPLASASGQSVRAVAFSPNGGTLAIGASNGRTYLWDPATRQNANTLVDQSSVSGVSGTQGVHAIAYSHDGAMLAAADQNGFTFVFNADGQPAFAGPLQDHHRTYGGVLAVAFSPDGQYLATGDGNGYVNIWDAADRGFPGLGARPGLPAGHRASVQPE